MKKPEVSIVLTNYNGEKYIGRTIQSVLDQTYKDWELIIVDDGSTDKSLAIIGSITDSRIKIITATENGQVSQAHNIGNRAACGSYIAIIDNDDIWKPDKLEKQIRFLVSHPEIGVCFSLAEFIDQDDRKIQDPEMEHIITVTNKPKEKWLHDMLTTGSHLVNSSSVMRKCVLEDCGDNDLGLLQLHDYDYWVRCAHKYELHVIQEPLLLYRRHSNSSSAKTYGRIHRACFEFAWIIGRTIIDMPTELFCKVFKNEMIHPQLMDPDDVLCEKAILLSSDLLHENCRVFAYYLFSKILKDERLRNVLKNHYNMNQHDVYKMTAINILFDRFSSHEFSEQNNRNKNLEKNFDELQMAYYDLLEKYQKASNDFLAIQASPYWKVTLPVRRIVNMTKKKKRE